MNILVSGSLAYDSIMTFEGHFASHILPEKVDNLNVSFHVPHMRVEYGGCAGNIAWNLRLLGIQPITLATVGDDFANYQQRLKKHAIRCDYITRIENTLTAQAYITTDKDNNQINFFHPGAMNHAHKAVVPQNESIDLAIIGPNGRDGMIAHMQQCQEQGIDTIFDPGQAMPLFSATELMDMLECCRYMTVNEYEAELFLKKTGQSIEAITSRVDALLVTLGENGSRIHTQANVFTVPAIAAKTVDPTGCGDAYRAGLIYGLAGKHDLQTSAQLASVMGGLKVASAGGQNHVFTREQIAEKYRSEFGDSNLF